MTYLRGLLPRWEATRSSSPLVGGRGEARALAYAHVRERAIARLRPSVLMSVSVQRKRLRTRVLMRASAACEPSRARTRDVSVRPREPTHRVECVPHRAIRHVQLHA